MRKAKIVSIAKFPRIILRDENNKLRSVELEAVQSKSSACPYLHLVVLHSYLYRPVEYAVSKQTSKAKILDQTGINIIEYLIIKSLVQLNPTQLAGSVLYSAEEQKRLLELRCEQQLIALTDVVSHNSTMRTLKLQDGLYQIEQLGDDIVVSKGILFFPVRLVNICTNFAAFEEEEFIEFLERNQQIAFSFKKVTYDLVHRKYVVKAYLPIDIELEIIRKGWGVLSASAEVQLPVEQYKKYLEASTESKNAFRGVWKTTMDIFSLIYVKNNFLAVVLEVIEGNVFKIKNLANGEIMVVELSKIICPTHQELGAFECREFARKQTIGKHFNAYIQKQSGFNVRATLIRNEDHEHLDKLIVSNGWGTVRKEIYNKKETEIVRLIQFENKCIESKVGIFSNKLGIFRFEDLTNIQSKEMQARARQFYDRIATNKNNTKLNVLSGVIERFRTPDILCVRLNTHKALINLKLEGIHSETKPFKVPLVKEIKQYSNQFFYQNYNQRDVEVVVKYLDEGLETYVGTVSFNKRDISEVLLAEGLVFYDDHNKNKKYSALEEEAKAAEKGWWMPKYAPFRIEKVEDEIMFKATISEIMPHTGTVFYQPSKLSEKLNWINNEIADSKKKIKPEDFRIGLVCAAAFEGELYRARVIAAHKNRPKDCTVLYIDYGNQLIIPKAELFEIQSQELLVFPEIAVSARLRFIKPLNSSNENFDILFEQQQNLLVGREVELLKIEDSIIVSEIGQPHASDKSLNASLIKNGLAKLNHRDANTLDPKLHKLFIDWESAARSQSLLIWDCYEDEEEENDLAATYEK